LIKVLNPFHAHHQYDLAPICTQVPVKFEFRNMVNTLLISRMSLYLYIIETMSFNQYIDTQPIFENSSTDVNESFEITLKIYFLGDSITSGGGNSQCISSSHCFESVLWPILAGPPVFIMDDESRAMEANALLQSMDNDEDGSLEISSVNDFIILLSLLCFHKEYFRLWSFHFRFDRIKFRGDGKHPKFD
jgi:hypothetical protein